MVLGILTAEPTSAESENYTTYVGSGLTDFGGLWMESDGLHWSYNGTEKYISESYSGSGGGTGVGDLDGVYSNGHTITLDEGAVRLNDATTSTANSFEIVQSGAKSGNLIDVAVNAALTGNVIDIDMNLGLASKAIYIDAGAGTKTANLIDVKHDGDGNIDVFGVTATNTGSGAIFDIDMNGLATGEVINVDMNAAVGAKFLYVDAGAGTRTADLIDIKHDGDGNVDVMNITATNTGTGAIFDISMDGAGSTSGVLLVDMNAAVGAEFLSLDVGGGIRTANLFDITYDGSGAVDFMAITATDTSSGHIFDIDMGGLHTGNVIDIDMDAAVASKAIYVDAGGGTRTADLIGVKHDGDGNVDVMDITATNTGTGAIFDISMDGDGSSSGVFAVDMNAAVGAPLMAIDCGAGTRTADLFDVTFDGDGNVGVMDIDCTNTGSGNLLDVDIDGIHTGNILDITYGTAASTGDAIKVTMGTNVAGSAVVLVGAGARSDDLIKIDDGSTGSGHIFDINLTAAYTGNVIDIATGNTTVAAAPINITRGTGTNTAASIAITDAGTSSGGVIDINVSGIATTAAVLDITYSAAATNDAIAITTADAVAASALVLTAAGARTDDLIKIVDSSTGNSHTFDIDFSGVYTGNCLDITYASAAATGNAIDLNMGTNVAGMAIDIATAATGTNNEGSAINITHTGNLVEGACVLRLDTTSNPANADGNIVELIQRTGAGQAGNNLLYLSATGTNVEAIKVDDGAVVFDETLTVTGACTFSSTITYRDKTETVAATNAISADESGSVFFLSHATEFVSTLPAPTAGLHFTFIVANAPETDSYTIVTNASANIIVGNASSAEDAAGSCDFEASGCDTITFVDGKAVVGDWVELFCDGTNWFTRGCSSVQDAITFTTAS
jgi:hypothetical protein